MNMVLIMIVVILLSLGVVGGLFVLMRNDQAPVEEEAVPITDIDEIKKELGAYVEPETQTGDAKGKEFDRDGFDVAKPLQGIEKEIHDVVESSKKVVDVPYETLMEDLEKESRQGNAIEDQAAEQVYVAKIQALQEENEILTERFNRVIDEKSKLETAMKQEAIEAQGKLDEAQEGIERMKQEIVHLKENFTQDDVTEIDTIRQGYEEQIAELNDQLDDLKKKLDVEIQKANVSTEKNDSSGSSDQEVAQLKQMNAQLMARVQQVQYDLTKNKAHITGLEKMCENYKIQIDKMNADHSSAVG